MDRGAKTANTALVVLAVLAVIAALYLLKPILVPVALAVVLACVLSPVTAFLRKVVPVSPTSAAVLLFVMTAILGLYLASITAESLVQAANTLPSDIERIAGRISRRVGDLIRERPYLTGILPDPKTIDQLGFNNAVLIADLRRYLFDLTGWVVQGLIILILVLFLLAEKETLMPRLVRFFASSAGDARWAETTLRDLTRQVRAYLLARTLINLGLGLVIGLALWGLGVKFAVALGLFAAVINFIPYLGQLIGGAAPSLIALGQSGSLGDALLVAAVYLAVVTIEGYVVTPFVLGRSLDLNGTTVLLACLFWGFLWGLMGLLLAMPITVCMKLVFQQSPELHRWAELMSRDWQTPPAAVNLGAESAPGEVASPLPAGEPKTAPAPVRMGGR